MATVSSVVQTPRADAHLIFQRKQEKWCFHSLCVARLLNLSTKHWLTLRLNKSDNTASQISQQQTVYWSQLFILLPEHTVGVQFVQSNSEIKKVSEFIHSVIHSLFMRSLMTIRMLGNHTKVIHSSAELLSVPCFTMLSVLVCLFALMFNATLQYKPHHQIAHSVV